MLAKVVRKVARHVLQWADSRLSTTADIEALKKGDFAYPWLNALFDKIAVDKQLRCRRNYLWAMIQSAFLAHELGVERISAIEFGVAGGNGLIALERIAERLEVEFKIAIDVYGFDSSRGLPKLQDYRDLPNLWPEGAYPMDEEKLRALLKRATLIIGLVRDTVPEFLACRPAPIGFIAFDLDLYSSTMDAFLTLEAEPAILMPRIYCYFDDILGLSYGHHNGERLAIAEFNAAHPMRQISQIYGLRFYLPAQVAHESWSEKMFIAHILDHKRYNEYDGQIQNPHMDLIVGS